MYVQDVVMNLHRHLDVVLKKRDCYIIDEQ